MSDSSVDEHVKVWAVFFLCEEACAARVCAVCCVAQMCVGGLSGCTGRLKMHYPVSHKVNKTASADREKWRNTSVV